MNQKAIYQRLADDTAISAVVSTRIYHDSPPLNPTLPYIVFLQVSEGQENPVNYVTERWQINLIGTLRPTNQSETLRTLKEAVIARLNLFKGLMGSGANTQAVKSIEFAGANEFPLPENREKQISLDFLFHYLRA